MKVLWLHNFNPKIKNSGVFMHQSLSFIKNHNNDCNVSELYLGNLKNPFVVIYSIFKVVIISKNYDVVHSQFGSMCGFVSSFAVGKKVITLRGSDWYKNNEAKFSIKLHNTFQNILSKITLNRYDCIVVVSNRMKEEVAKASNKPIVTIPSAIDPNKFYPMSKVECRNRLGLPINKKIFLYPVMKTSNSIKRPLLVKEIKDRLNSSTIILTASGVPHDEMIYWYNAVDAVLLPSIYEGWPNVIKESLLCNTPFIATDISDLDNIARKYKTCVIVKPDVKAILNAIENTDFKKIENLRNEVIWMNLKNMSNKLVYEVYK